MLIVHRSKLKQYFIPHLLFGTGISKHTNFGVSRYICLQVS